MFAFRPVYDSLKCHFSKANSPSARSKQPWVVVFGHREAVCSDMKRVGLVMGKKCVKFIFSQFLTEMLSSNLIFSAKNADVFQVILATIMFCLHFCVRIPTN
jgi:hypothetical protein